MYTMKELNEVIAELYEYVWEEKFVPSYNTSSDVIDDKTYIGSDVVYLEDDAVTVPYISTSLLLVSGSQLYYIFISKFINGDIEPSRLIHLDDDDEEAVAVFNKHNKTFVKDIIDELVRNIDIEDLNDICHNKSRQFLKIMNLNKDIDAKIMNHLPDAKVFNLEDFIIYQILKGKDYEHITK
jgi:hypothetical protein